MRPIEPGVSRRAFLGRVAVATLVAVTAFYVGLCAMQTTQEVLAREKFDRVVAIVPEEPAGWADLGLLLLRQQELDQGAEHLARAATLAPDSAA